MFGYNSRYINRYTGGRKPKTKDRVSSTADAILAKSKSADEALVVKRPPKGILRSTGSSPTRNDEKREDEYNNGLASTASTTITMTTIVEPKQHALHTSQSVGEEKIAEIEDDSESVEATFEETDTNHSLTKLKITSNGSVSDEASLTEKPVPSGESDDSNPGNNSKNNMATIPWMQQPSSKPAGTTPASSPGQENRGFLEGTLDSIPIMPHTMKRTDSYCDDASSISSRSSVSFGHVRVREYERVIDTRMYMGLSLGWAYNETSPKPVDDAAGDIENQSKGKQQPPQVKSPASVGGGGGGNDDDSVATTGDESKSKKKKPPERFGTLLQYGYSRKELKQATAEATKYQKQVEKEEAKAAKAEAAGLPRPPPKSSQQARQQPKRKTFLSRSNWR